MRTHINETKNKVDETVELFGWVHNRRDHGKLIFIDLRDRSGVVQVVFVPQQKDYEVASTLRSEWVVKIIGKVAERPEKMVNADIETGKIEIQPESLEVLSQSETPPFPLDTDGREIDEEVRLKYRYLDLRRERLQRNITLRSKFVDASRQFLFKKGFLEIETPILSAPTPEGSRDFVVPSRLNSGKFFALPQSPQQYKQLLMVAGFEKYFQIARCFRDEDLRADRGFEHTQIDMEMSFVNQADVMALDEELITEVVESLGYKIKQKPFPVLTYQESMDKYGADKFDLRDEEDKKNGVLAYAWVKDFPFFEKVKDEGPASRKASQATSSPALRSSEGAKKWTFTHNPFSAPKPKYMEDLMTQKNIGDILTTQYDVVLNGWEIGGGSIRNHRPEALEAVFKVMGFDKKRIEGNFGHMVQALKYGAPPHGGIAWGLDRLVSVLQGEPNIREVIAFPKTGDARDLMMGSPSELEPEQLKELRLKIEK